ncbi:hypothetical protein [Bordetella sp. 2513F-2]
MTTPSKPSAAGNPGQDRPPGEDDMERDLDEALEETFPASDPIAIRPESQREDRVDEALEDTFPASDPPSPVQPDKK